MRLLLLPLPLLVSLLGSVHAQTHATIRATLQLVNSTTPLDIGAVAVLSPAPSSSIPHHLSPERTAEVYGPPGEYHISFPAVQAGHYVLRIESRRYAFQDYHLAVRPTDVHGDELHVEASLYSTAHQSAIPGSSLDHPLTISSTHLFTSHPPPPPAFSLFAFLKGNPMVWITLLGVGLAVGTPKLIASMDEETRREIEERQRGLMGLGGGGGGGGGTTQSLSSFDASSSLSRYLAGSNPVADVVGEPPAAGRGTTGGGGGKGKGGKKRR